MGTKQILVTITGNIDASQMEDVIYQGLQYYEDIEWTSYSANEVVDWRKEEK